MWLLEPVRQGLEVASPREDENVDGRCWLEVGVQGSDGALQCPEVLLLIDVMEGGWGLVCDVERL